MKRIIVGISGASGSIFGVRFLESLREVEDVETHLVISKWGQQTLEFETGLKVSEVKSWADFSYSPTEMGAAISSGSFLTDGMVIVPASMRTISSIAHGFSDHLIHRAADVILKEKRKLVVVPRETPLSQIHLENLLKLSTLGVTILPPEPAFYNKPKSVNDIVDHIVARICDQFGILNELTRRWNGKMKNDDVVPFRG